MKSKLHLWRDAQGKVVIWQTPNPLLWGWILCGILGAFVKGGPLNHELDFLKSAFLFAWAYLEITSGVNYVRRGLGITVLIYLVVSHWR